VGELGLGQTTEVGDAGVEKTHVSFLTPKVTPTRRGACVAR
jgi:hypothetical protein